MVRAVTGAAIVVLCVVAGARHAGRAAVDRTRDGAGLDARIPQLLDLAVRLTRAACSRTSLLVGLAALAMGALNAHHRFFTAALGPAVLNVAMIVAVLGLASPARHRPSCRWRSACSWAGSASSSSSCPSCAGSACRCARRSSGAHPAVRAHRAAPLARGVRAGRGAGHGGREHAARLAAARGHRLVPLLRGPRDGVPARRVRHRARHRGAAQHVGARPRAGRSPRAARRRSSFALRLSAFVAVPATVGLLLLGGPIVQAALRARASSAAADAAPPPRPSPATRSDCPPSRPRASPPRPSTRSATRGRRCSSGFVVGGRQRGARARPDVAARATPGSRWPRRCPPT